MPTILIGGYYGAGNIGDEAILDSIVSELRAQYERPSELSLIVLSWDPESTSKDFDVDSIHWKDLESLVESIKNIDLVILGGGGLFFDYWGIDPDTYLRQSAWDITAYGSLPLLAKIMDIPCMIYGVGVGPLNDQIAREHTRLAFQRCDIATVRDKKSYDLLIDIGVKVENSGLKQFSVYPDPVFSLTTGPDHETRVDEILAQHQIDTKRSLFGVSLRYWDFDGPLDTWLQHVANSVKEFLVDNPDAYLLCIPFQSIEDIAISDDISVLTKFADLIGLSDRISIINDPLSPRVAQTLIKRCKITLGMRMHAVVMSINAHTPVIALSYASKVRSVMALVDLEAFCNPILIEDSEKLKEQIQFAWDHNAEIRQNIQRIATTLADHSKEHSRLALALLSSQDKKPLRFSQKFALDQVRLMLKIDQKSASLKTKKDELQEQVWALNSQISEDQLKLEGLREKQNFLQEEIDRLNALYQSEIDRLNTQLTAIQSTNVWKLGQRYYHLRDTTILRYPYKFAVSIKEKGFFPALRKILNPKKEPPGDDLTLKERASNSLHGVIEKINHLDSKGVFLLTSAFKFDELYNQRVINLAKYLAAQGWSVIYVAWVWHDESEAPPGEVMKNIFQVPSNYFFNAYETLEKLNNAHKYFVAEFPHPEFLTAAIRLRNSGFAIVYEIIDEWEEFHNVGQAIWYRKPIEEAFVINANLISAVSEPLVEKFSELRQDIFLIPNGFTPSFLGPYQDIAQRQFKHATINLGYFGHLTPAWFDWLFLKDILVQADHHDLDLHVELIGYGEPNLDEVLGKYREKVKFYGKILPGELHKYVEEWDLAMIPFKSSALSEAVDPIKIYEYLYFGLPVIVKGIPHLKNLPGVSVVSNASQFLEILINLRESGVDEQDAMNLAAFTWESRFSKLVKLLEDETWMSL